MKMTWYIPFVAALVPLVVGMVWYNAKVFGTAWMKVTGVTPEAGKKANMPLIFGLTYLFSLMVCVIVMLVSIHQIHLFGILEGEADFKAEGSQTQLFIQDFMAKYGDRFRTFKHGAFSGGLLGVFCALPVLGINALFEMKGFKYIMINAGYWIVSMALMGGVLCAWL